MQWQIWGAGDTHLKARPTAIGQANPSWLANGTTRCMPIKSKIATTTTATIENSNQLKWKLKFVQHARAKFDCLTLLLSPLKIGSRLLDYSMGVNWKVF